MLVLRNPSLSTITPPRNPARTTGRKLKNTASAVSHALPVVVEHEPRDRELRDGVPGERDRVRDVERVQRSSPHGA